MALTDYLLNFTKDWRKPEDFPTYETKETKVREDMQLLFNEMKNAFNRFVADLSAGLLPFSSSEDIPASNVQEAILEVQSQIGSAVTGNIPNRSLTAQKLQERTLTADEMGDGTVISRVLADGAVTEGKIADDAVTEDKIADGAVTGDKIEDYCIGESHLGSEAVTGPKIKDGEVGTLKLENDAVTSAKLKDANVTAAKLATDSVETAKIKDANVTNAKLASADANGANGAVSTDKINNAAVTAAKIAANAVSTAYSGTLTVAGWTGSAAPFTQELAITGILESDVPLLDLIPSNVYSTAVQEDEAWGQIYKAVTGADSITFYAKVKPTVALTFSARCIRK